MLRAWRIRDFRTVFHLACRMGLTPEVIADSIGLPAEVVLNVMKGNASLDDARTLRSIASGLGMSDEARQILGLPLDRPTIVSGVPAQPRYCDRCGTRLAGDNQGRACGPCGRHQAGSLMASGPPLVPAEFWQVDLIRDSLTGRHMGHFLRAYREHPFHGSRGIPQEVMARWLRLSQTQLSRIETGPAVNDLRRLTEWARLFRIPRALLWFDVSVTHPRSFELPIDKGIRKNSAANASETPDVRLRLTVGARIAELRRDCGLTQEELADRAEISIDTVRKIEQHARTPSLAMLDSVALALGVSPGELVDPPAPKGQPGRPRERRPNHLPASVLGRPDFIAACYMRDLGAMFNIAAEIGFTPSHLARRCEMTVSQVRAYMLKQRAAQRIEIFDRVSDGLHVPGEMLGIGRRSWESEDAIGSTEQNIEESKDHRSSPESIVDQAFNADDEDRIIYAARKTGRADARMVDSLAKMLAVQREAEDSLGSAAFIQPMMAQLATIESLVADARGTVRPSITDVAAQYAEFAGWLHTSVGRWREARAWFDRTSEWATESGDVTLAAKSLSWKGHLAFLQGEVGPMLGLTQAAQRDASVWVGQRAYDAFQEARGLALVGDSEMSIRKADEGSNLALVADERSDQRPACSYYYTMPFYMVERGLVYRFLGRDDAAHNDEAISCLAEGLHDMGAARSSEWAAQYIYHLAIAYAQIGSPDKACECAFEILQIALSTESARLMEYIGSICARLAQRWPNDPCVAELDEAIHQRALKHPA